MSDRAPDEGGGADTAPQDPQPPEPDQSAEGSKAGKLAMIGAVTITLVNLGFAGWGFSILQDAKGHVEKAEQSAKDAEKAKNALKKTVESSYFLHDIQLKRELRRWIVDMPGLELKGPSRKATIQNFENGLKALTELEAHIPPHKKTKTNHFILGFLKFQERAWPDAIFHLNKFPERIPEKYLLLGAAHHRNGDIQTAKGHFKEANELSGQSRGNTIKAKALNSLGITAAVVGDFVEAELLFRQALKADRDLYGVYSNIAGLYVEQKKFKEAIKELCEFHKRAEITAVKRIKTDPDGTLDPIKAYFISP